MQLWTFWNYHQLPEAKHTYHCHCNLQDILWQCFLQSSESAAGPTTVEASRIDRMGMDSAKLHCCSKAESSTCRRLCLKTFSNEWTRSWDEFDRECLSKLSEDSLFHCIDEGSIAKVVHVHWKNFQENILLSFGLETSVLCYKIFIYLHEMAS
jgi:hypothetical protein